VTVVINDRHLTGMLMIQPSGRLIPKDKVVMYEGAICHCYNITLPSHATLSGKKSINFSNAYMLMTFAHAR